VTFDEFAVPVGVVGYDPRWIPGEVSSDFGQFSGWQRDAGITVAPGASIIIRDDIEDLELLSVRAAFFERVDVEAYLEPESTSEVNTVNVQRRSAGAKGRIGIPVDLEPGLYVMEVVAAMQTPCVEIEAYEVVSVEVR
jgi:hypothetical protein